MTTIHDENFLYQVGAIPNTVGTKTQLMYLLELAGKGHLDGLRYALLLAAERIDCCTLPLLIGAIQSWRNAASIQLEAWGNQPPPSELGWRQLRLNLAKEDGGAGMRYAVASYLAPGLVTPAPHYLANVHLFHEFADTVRLWEPKYRYALVDAVRSDFSSLAHLLDGAIGGTISWLPSPSIPVVSGPTI